MSITQTTPMDTTHSGNDEIGHYTTDREIQSWLDTPENGIYAGKKYLITTVWRGNQPGMRHTMVSSSSAPYVEAGTAPAAEIDTAAADADKPAIEWGTRVKIVGGPDMNHGTVGTVVNRYSIRHGHMMNDILTSWGTRKNYYSDDQLEFVAPAPEKIGATVHRIAAASGNRDADYYQPICVCSWEGASYSNRTIEGRELADKAAADHQHAPGAKIWIGTLGKWNNHS